MLQILFIICIKNYTFVAQRLNKVKNIQRTLASKKIN